MHRALCRTQAAQLVGQQYRHRQRALPFAVAKGMSTITGSQSVQMRIPSRHFAALDPDQDGVGAKSEARRGTKELKLRAIVFDVDGTMCLPQNYMFGEMREALGISKSVDILDHVYSLPESEQNAAMEKVKGIERNAMSRQAPQPGLTELMAYLDSRQIPKAICTRNFNGPVEHLLDKFLPHSKFLPIITRDFRPPKPDPAGILHIAAELGIEKEAYRTQDGEVNNEANRETLPMIMVGDSIDDMMAGSRAGAATVLLANPDNLHLADHECTDLVISRLDDLIKILDRGFEVRPQK